MHNAPICLFCYRRVDTLRSTIEALRRNPLSIHSDLIVYSDGPRSPADEAQVREVRELIKSIQGFSSVSHVFRDKNLGLSKSVIEGVSEVLRVHEGVIVLEDDLVTSINFLHFMNAALETYKNKKEVMSVTGFAFPIEPPTDYPYDAAFGPRPFSFGWATWRNRWENIDWSVADYAQFATDSASQHRFKEGGSDLVRMLSRQMSGEIDSWAIRFAYAQFRRHAYTVFPLTSKVQNIGFGADATHTVGMEKRFRVSLDQSEAYAFRFPSEVILRQDILAQNYKPFSLQVRLASKLSRLFSRS